MNIYCFYVQKYFFSSKKKSNFKAIKKVYYPIFVLLLFVVSACVKIDFEKTQSKLVNSYWIGEDDNKNLLVYQFKENNILEVFDLTYCITDCSHWNRMISFNDSQYLKQKFSYNWFWKDETSNKINVVDIITAKQVYEIEIIEITNSKMILKTAVESELVRDNSFAKSLE
ncbi:MAG: hypothetical protein JXR68_00015 [Bacteroidales bacterium]|nr:hypothetical protein [Bacteroidales bacterium]